MSDLIPENQVSEKQDIPSVTVGDVIHSCGTDNFCVATIVSGIFANFEDKGMIVVTVAFPSGGMPAVCNSTPVLYHKPRNKEDRPIRTWHLKEECVGGCKRLDNQSRIIH